MKYAVCGVEIMIEDSIKNLTVGQRIKNYKELCKLLNEEEKTGKSRQLQLVDWNRYFRYSKSGNAYIIEEIFAEPITKIDKRKYGNTNNNKYGNIIQKLMIDFLVTRGGTAFETISYFLTSFSMANYNYTVCQDKIPSFVAFLGIDGFYAYEFYFLVRKNFRDIFETAIKALEKQNRIEWEKIQMVCVENNTDMNPIESINKDFKRLSQKHNNTSAVYPTKHRIASKEEIKLIEDTEKLLLLEMGFKDKQAVQFSGRAAEFRKSLRDILLDKAGIYYTYYKYSVFLKHYEDEMVLKTDEKVELIEALNNVIINNIIASAHKRQTKVHVKYPEELAFGEPIFKSKTDRFRYNEKYVQYYEMMTDILIKRNAKSIKTDLGLSSDYEMESELENENGGI